MLATTALLFSLLLQSQGTVSGKTERYFTSVAGETAVTAGPAAHERSQHEQSVAHASPVMAIPVSFEMDRVAIPPGVEQVFSHRRIDEFLQQEIQSDDGTQSF